MKKFRLLKADEIDCRAAKVTAKGVALLLYKDARADYNLLDETVGPMNWQCSYSRENANCVISIWDEDKKQWISKENTGTESNTEKEKGLASDSLKRAGFCWGIGRELYTAPFIWIGAENAKIQEASGGRFTCYEKFKVADIGYDENERIASLTIVDSKGKEVYTFGSKSQERSNRAVSRGLSDADVRKVIGLLAENAIPPTYVSMLYKVASIKDLTPAKVKNIEDNIDKLKAQYEEYKKGK